MYINWVLHMRGGFPLYVRAFPNVLMAEGPAKSCGIRKSESQEKSKNRKKSEKSDKIGKIGFDFQLDFLAKMPKRHKML